MNNKMICQKQIKNILENKYNPNSYEKEQRTFIQDIRDNVQNELLKRGFTIPIELTIDLKRNKLKFKITSEKFQTFPVIFKELRINSYLSGCYQKEDDVIEIFIGVAVSTKSFEGGENGIFLFKYKNRIFIEEKSNILGGYSIMS